MANINKLEILSGNYVSSDNKVYNLVDILKDKLNYTQGAKFSLSNTNLFNDLSGNIVGSDNKVYNLVDILNDGSTPIPPTPTYTFTINPTPGDAIVKINDVERTSITAEENTNITWSVEKEGYTSQSGELTLTEDKTLDVVLEATPVGWVQTGDLVVDGVTAQTTNYSVGSGWNVSGIWSYGAEDQETTSIYPPSSVGPYGLYYNGSTTSTLDYIFNQNMIFKRLVVRAYVANPNINLSYTQIRILDENNTIIYTSKRILEDSSLEPTIIEFSESIQGKIIRIQQTSNRSLVYINDLKVEADYA